ncbi:MAG: DUF4149 domain-containing protein [Gammaproteobacteria bacterium]|nr:DUF4149 domain-containing protein [Gammaproteobacteria bacterium]
MLMNGFNNILLAAWFGIFVCAGYVMEPVLVSGVDRITANQLASTMFDVVTWIGIVCAFGVLINNVIKQSFKHWRNYLTLGLLLLMLFNLLWFLPEISALMNVEKPEGSELRVHYDLMHTLSISDYMLTVLGVAVLVFTNPNRQRT